MIATKYTYILVDFFCIIVPLIFSFHPKIKFTKQLKYFWPICILTALFFICWDMIFTASKIWAFNPEYLLGINVGNLPLEEILFFICIPYPCVFTYYCCTLFFKIKPSSNLFFSIVSISSVLLILIGIVNIEKLYTSVTFITLGLFTLLLSKRTVPYLKTFFISFLLILLPFFISNGILTGSFTEKPVVTYDDSYNLSIRMFTIPVEDLFYGMLMLLMNVAGFEFIKGRLGIKNQVSAGIP